MVKPPHSAGGSPSTARSGRSLRPSLPRVLCHATLYLLRNACLCALFTVLVAEPLYLRVVALPRVRALSPAAFMVLLHAVACHAVPWVVINGVFGLMDSLLPGTGGSPLLRCAPFRRLGGWLARFKLPRRPAQQPSPALMRRTILTALVQNWLITPAVLYFALRSTEEATAASLPPRDATIAGLARSGGGRLQHHSSPHSELLIGLLYAIPHFMAANLVNEVGFFCAHASLHAHPWLYRTFHKQHHEYTGTISIAAEYAGLLESIAANTLPTVGYFLWLMMGHDNAYPSAMVQSGRAWVLLAVWMWARLWETYETHSGFSFADTVVGRMGLLHGKKARFHDFHHTHNVGNYGACVLMDGLCGTMDAYLRHRQQIKSAPGGEKGEKKSMSSVDTDADAAHVVAAKKNM